MCIWRGHRYATSFSLLSTDLCCAALLFQLWAPWELGVEVLGFEMEDRRLWRAGGPLGSFNYIQAPHASKPCTNTSILSEGTSREVVSGCYHVIHISPLLAGFCRVAKATS
jgi:hypothetical protein